MAEERLGGAYFELSGRSNVGQVVNQANSSFAQLEQVVAQNWWGVQNLGMAFAALPAAVAAGTAAAVAMAKQWEDAMFDVARTSGEAGQKLAEIEDSLLRVARTTPIATAELASIASEGAALGIANENLAEFSRVMGLMIASTDLTAEGMENVARVLNIMQVPVEDYEAFASALIEVGRNTAATESDIITAAKRLATVASIANVSTESVLAMGAALRSLGPEAEAGATAVNKTVSDMAAAINSGGSELDAFASVAGMTAEEFGRAFQQDAYVPLAAFITGLGQLEGDTLGIEDAFDRTGIKATRTKQALSTLANGTRDVGNTQRDYNAILELTAGAYAENTILADLQAKKLNTVSGQMETLRNHVFEAGQAFGKILLPSLKQVIGVTEFFAKNLANIARGFGVMNPAVRMMVSIVALLTFGIMALIAGIVLVGPRIVIAIGAMRQLRTAALANKTATDALTASQNQNAAATQRQAMSYTQMQAGLARVTAAMDGMSARQREEYVRLNQTTQAAERKTGALQRLRGAYGNLSTATKRAMAVTIAMTGAMIAMAYWAHRAGKAITDAENAHADRIATMRNEIAELVALNQENGNSADAIKQNALAYVRQQKTYKDMARAARILKVDIGELNGVLTGDTGEGRSAQIINDLHKQAREGDKSAAILFNSLKELYGVTADVRDVTKDSTAELAAYNREVEESSDALKEHAALMEKVAQSHIDYVGALFAARSADLALKDAADDLAEARNKAQNQGLEIQKAELAIRKARLDHEKALQNLRKAEVDLTRARQKGRDELADAEANLADSRDSYLDGLEKIKDMEEDLDKLRKGPTLEELTKATNELRNAQLSLLSVHRKVSDAEWYLQYIREQGGSQRDIADAEFILMEARQDVANAQEKLNDSEKELADLRDEEARRQDIIKAERDLAGVRRDSLATLRDIRDGEQNVYDLRKKVAADQFYKDAQADLIDAQISVKDAINSVRDAELDLRKIRAGSLQRDLAKAQLDYEQALYRVAEANAAVREAADGMNGIFWNTSDRAKAIADELRGLADGLDNIAAKQRLLSTADVLIKVPTIPKIPDDVVEDYQADLEDSLGGATQNAIDKIFSEVDPVGGTLGNASWWQSFLPLVAGALAPFGFAIGSRLVGAIGSMISSAAAGSALAIASAVALIGALFIGFLIFWFSDPKRREDFMRGLQVIGDWFVDIGGMMIDGLQAGLGMAGRALTEWIPRKFREWIIDPIKRLFGIDSPSTLFASFGADIIRGLIKGLLSLATGIAGVIGTITGSITGAFTGAATWLFGAGRNIAVGLWNGITSLDVLGWFRNLPSKIWSAIGGDTIWKVGSTLFVLGENIVKGLWNGITGMGKWLWDKLSEFVERNIPGPIKWVLDMFSPSRVMQKLGEDVARGLGEGILSQTKVVEDAASAIAEAAKPKAKDLAQAYDLGYLLTSDGVGRFDPAVGNARVPNGSGGTTNNYGDVVTINAETNADPQEIVNEYVWAKRVRTRG